MRLQKFPLSWNCTCILLLMSILSVACTSEKRSSSTEKNSTDKIGVLLVNHGSRSATWRQALLDLEATVRDSILAPGVVQGVSTAFMEYTEPSIATRLREFDQEGYTHVVIVPVFLTVSPHTFEDIPTIIGQKEDPHSMEMLRIEKIQRYTPKAKTVVTPLLDFTDIIRKNILRRTEMLSSAPAKEGLVLIGYGDEDYTKEWGELFASVGEYVKTHKGIDTYSYGWCGHIAHYNPDSTSIAIRSVLATKEKAIVVPVLVAHDEMFQVKIIGDGIDRVAQSKERVVYKPDAILPDPNVSRWVVDIAREYSVKVIQ